MSQKWTLLPGDCQKSLKMMAAKGIFVDSVVTDPPYNIESIVKRFGKASYKAAGFGSDGVFQRSSERFVGQTWDESKIAQDSQFWSLVRDVMKPGAYLLAFGFPRNVHRQVCAIEDAGFVIHPPRFWRFRTGMPKPHPVDKAMTRSKDPVISAESAKWAGWAYGAQSLRPEVEPIVFAQKPFSEKTGPANIVRHGVGAVNIDACRGPEGEYPTTFVEEVFESPKAAAKDRSGSDHPSVKPVGLMKDLCRLITPPGGLVLDPFAGSGSTGQAAVEEGFRIIMMEREENFLQDIRNRMAKVK